MKSYFIPPDGFYIGTFQVKFYGLIMAFSMLVGVLLAIKLAKKHKIKSDDILLLALIVLPLSVVGARLYYCIFYSYNYSFWELFNIRQGGLAIYGGVIGGILGVIIFALIKKDIKLVLVVFDILAPCLILGQCLGRWGNFFNQEAYGNLVTNKNMQWFPYAVFIEDKNAWYQATFFYESLWNFVGFLMLLFVYKRSKMIGSTAGLYFIWYGIGRTLIEGLRSDSLYVGSSNIRVSQVLSMILVLIGLTMVIINLVRLKKGRVKNE